MQCKTKQNNICYNRHLRNGILLGSESTYMKEAQKSAGIVCKIAGIDPFIDYHCNPGQILPHFYVKNIFLAQILADNT